MAHNTNELDINSNNIPHTKAVMKCYTHKATVAYWRNIIRACAFGLGHKKPGQHKSFDVVISGPFFVRIIPLTTKTHTDHQHRC